MHEIVAVLLYGALMRRRVAGERLDVLPGVVEHGVVVPGVGVGASTGCAHVVVAGPNPNTLDTTHNLATHESCPSSGQRRPAATKWSQ